MKNSFYSMIFRQRYIRRWGLMRNMTEETLTEHSYEVSILTHALCSIGNTYFDKNYDIGKAVSYALFHDAQEVYTGDMPTPAKYYNESMRRNYAEIEDNATKKLLSMLPEELQPDYSELLEQNDKELHLIVKSADKLSAYIKCIEELKCNNNEFKSAAKSTLKALEENPLPELHYFMENFLPAFTSDLDELQM